VTLLVGLSQATESSSLVRESAGFSQATESSTLPLTVPPWALVGEGIVKVRVTVNAPLLVSVRFNDTVLSVAP
jgi:hypothetical protein